MERNRVVKALRLRERHSYRVPFILRETSIEGADYVSARGDAEVR
jgi:hypothetical protein